MKTKSVSAQAGRLGHLGGESFREGVSACVRHVAAAAGAWARERRLSRTFMKLMYAS